MFPLKPPFYFINVYVHRAHQVPTFSMFCAASAPAFRCFRTSAWLWQSAGTEKRSHQQPNMTATPFPSRCFSRSWNCLSCRLTNWKHLESVLQSFKGASNCPRAERCFLGAQVWAFVGVNQATSPVRPCVCHTHQGCGVSLMISDSKQLLSSLALCFFLLEGPSDQGHVYCDNGTLLFFFFGLSESSLSLPLSHQGNSQHCNQPAVSVLSKIQSTWKTGNHGFFQDFNWDHAWMPDHTRLWSLAWFEDPTKTGSTRRNSWAFPSFSFPFCPSWAFLSPLRIKWCTRKAAVAESIVRFLQIEKQGFASWRGCKMLTRLAIFKHHEVQNQWLTPNKSRKAEEPKK